MRKNSFVLSLIIALMVFSNACKPYYKCGETKPGKNTTFFWSKRTKTLLNERDTLCKNLSIKENENAQLEKDTFDLKNKISQQGITIMDLTNKKNELETNLNNLQGKYDSLVDQNISQAEQYNKTLKQKSAELKKKEELLADREQNLHDLQAKLNRQDSITKALNDVIRKALLGFKSDELSVEVKNGKVYVSMSDKLLFKSGSADVESKGKDALKVLAEVLNKNTDIDILVEGHTDSDPIKSAVFKDNWDLSVVRATSIVRILTEDYNVSPKRVTAAGRGEFFPKATNKTAEGKAKNRRTEIILSPKLDEIMKLLDK
jgi:chemotaxis protein MotB